MTAPVRPRRKLKRSALAVGAAALAGLFLVSNCGESRRVSISINVGTQAGLFLKAEPFPQLLVEVDYVGTHPPSTGALALLEQRLGERLNKPGGIQVVVDDAIPAVEGPTDEAQLLALEREHRDFATEGSRLTMYVLYLNGEGERSNLLAVAFAPSAFAVFPDRIEAAANAVASPEEVERATVVHELGHLLGLVNLGTPMVENHSDPSHLTHDRSRSCVMHHEIETTSVRVLLENGGAPPDDFDAACVADLRAAGGR